jgi:hypothetical protein
MKVSLIALYTCCAVSSAAFAYQNQPQSGQTAHSSALATRGGSFVMREDPGVDPPRAAINEDPGVDPPRAAINEDPGVDPPRAAINEDPGVDPPRGVTNEDPGVDPPRVALRQGRFLDLPLRN